MKRLRREEDRLYEFSRYVLPKIRVKQGESFIIETEDAFSGVIQSADDPEVFTKLPGRDCLPPLSNPITGPIYIEGARRGDLLEVTIEDISVDNQGCCAFFLKSGPSEVLVKWPVLKEGYILIFDHLTDDKTGKDFGQVKVNENTSWPLHPMVGTIGVAPDREVIASVWGQGPWGGNLDCRDITVGAKFYVNCYHDGALLYVGDVHASQGDTELCSVADETRAAVTISCRVIPKKQIPFPRLETPTCIISLFSAKPLEDAVMSAVVNLMGWLVREHGFTPREAYLHLSANPDFRINVYQMVEFGSMCYTVGAEFPKIYLKL